MYLILINLILVFKVSTILLYITLIDVIEITTHVQHVGIDRDDAGVVVQRLNSVRHAVQLGEELRFGILVVWSLQICGYNRMTVALITNSDIEVNIGVGTLIVKQNHQEKAHHRPG